MLSSQGCMHVIHILAVQYLHRQVGLLMFPHTSFDALPFSNLLENPVQQGFPIWPLMVNAHKDPSNSMVQIGLACRLSF